ncbi:MULTISPECIES: class I SAM-dependent methyltransferase [Nocardioides]|uniref:Class I SAM-dependent methyltransferase n=1 Tax=Nocardioides vastitatis TaxID=2568655 RepID=A0ABW0ZP42_9ACTN|nr:methyltransferase domain-containing protein [Nocardioides sp.]THI94382.1 methyltransferase domain-containing protein [Nocardioides sp.]
MTETFQITREQAQTYDDQFVPALFAQWAPQLVDCARVRPGQSVLDVACGTGVVAKAARAVVGSAGRVVGADLNPAMLEVARDARPDLEWAQGDAEDLPFADAEFDVALCQSGLFFFADPGRAVAEMARVVAPGGLVGLQTYASLAEQPAYGPFVDLIARHTGPEARALLGTYWSHGDLDDLLRLTSAAGLSLVESRSSLGVAVFPTAGAVADTEIQATPLADRITPETHALIVADTEKLLGQYADESGRVQVPIRATLVAARKQ